MCKIQLKAGLKQENVALKNHFFQILNVANTFIVNMPIHVSHHKIALIKKTFLWCLSSLHS